MGKSCHFAGGGKVRQKGLVLELAGRQRITLLMEADEALDPEVVNLLGSSEL